MTLLEEAVIQWQQAGDARGMVIALGYLGLAASDRGDAARGAVWLAEALALVAASGNKHALTFCLPAVAVLAAARGGPARAARLFGATAALNEALGSAFALPERAAYERATNAARLELGEAAFATAWTEGRALPPEQAVAEAAAALEAVAPAGDSGSEPVVSSPAPAGPAPDTGCDLTFREREVLSLLAAGHSNRAIANTLFVSLPTVKGHVSSILAKLGVGSRAAAVSEAHRRGLA